MTDSDSAHQTLKTLLPTNLRQVELEHLRVVWWSLILTILSERVVNQPPLAAWHRALYVIGIIYVSYRVTGAVQEVLADG